MTLEQATKHQDQQRSHFLKENSISGGPVLNVHLSVLRGLRWKSAGGVRGAGVTAHENHHQLLAGQFSCRRWTHDSRLHPLLIRQHFPTPILAFRPMDVPARQFLSGSVNTHSTKTKERIY